MGHSFRNDLASISSEATEAYLQLIEPLSIILNRLHSVSHSNKYWEVLVGPWLRVFTFVYLERLNGLNNGRYEKFTLDKGATKQIDVAQNFHHFMKSVETSTWNTNFCGLLLDDSPFNFSRIDGVIDKGPVSQIKWSARHAALWCTSAWNRFFGPTHETVLIATYLPLADELKTHLRLRQVPTNHLQSVETQTTEHLDVDWRLGADASVDFSTKTAVGEMLRLVKVFIPRSYVEDYELLCSDVRIKSFPKSPRRVFTSNAFWFDDVFKQYMARCQDSGTKLAIGQHGGVFGTALYSMSEDHQLEIADSYFSFGWNRKPFENRIQPLGNFKTASVTLRRSAEPQKILLVLTAAPTFPRFATGGPMTETEWFTYVGQQVSFVRNLGRLAKGQVLLRLKPNAFGLDQVQPWKNVVPSQAMNLGVGSLNNLLKDAKLVVVTYEGTTHLDTFLLGIPTVLLLEPTIWPLRSEATVIYDRLEEAGLLFYDAEKAAKHVDWIIKTGVDEWWHSPAIRAALGDFVNVFSRPIAHVPAVICEALESLT
jgi:putative transferase (TIGR04331 family)